MPGVNAMLKMFVLKVSLGLLMLRHFSAPVFESLWNEVCLLFGFAFTCSLLLRAEIKRWNRLRTFFFCPSKGMLERTLPGHATNLVNSVQFYIHRWMFCNITMTGQPQYESALPYPTGTRISRQLHIPDQSKFKDLKFNSLFVIDFICRPLLNGFPPWPVPSHPVIHSIHKLLESFDSCYCSYNTRKTTTRCYQHAVHNICLIFRS